MCDNIVAKFKNANRHKQAREGRLRFKYIVKCRTVLQSPTSATYPPILRSHKHVLQEVKPKKNCPKCKGEMPPKTL